MSHTQLQNKRAGRLPRYTQATGHILVPLHIFTICPISLTTCASFQLDEFIHWYHPHSLSHIPLDSRYAVLYSASDTSGCSLLPRFVCDLTATLNIPPIVCMCHNSTCFAMVVFGRV